MSTAVVVQSMEKQQSHKRVSNHALGQLYKIQQVSSPQGRPLLAVFAATEDQILFPTAREETVRDALQGTGKQDQGRELGSTPS